MEILRELFYDENRKLQRAKPFQYNYQTIINIDDKTYTSLYTTEIAATNSLKLIYNLLIDLQRLETLVAVFKMTFNFYKKDENNRWRAIDVDFLN
jgi:hypothetical protein